MSKARITYRFEHAGPKKDGRAAEPGAADRGAPSRKADERSASNVIPLKHIEFPVSDEPVVVEQMPREPAKPVPFRRLEADYPYDYGAWRDPADAEADELERIIRETPPYDESLDADVRRGGKRDPERPRRRAASPSDDARGAFGAAEPIGLPDRSEDPESGYWPTADEFVGTRRSAASRRTPPEGPAWWKVAGAVVGAVATGVLFGTVMLNLFAGDGTSQPPAASIGAPLEGDAGTVDGQAPASGAVGEAAGAGATDASGDGAAVADGATAAATAAIDLPERRMFLLQNGMFESIESARALADEMKSKGLAATIEEGEKFYVYAGVTSDRDAALRAGVKLQDAGVEVYVKAYDLPQVRQIAWASADPASAQALADYVAKGSELVRMIGDLTLVHMEDDTAVAPDAATLETLKGEHFALTKLSPDASSGLTAEAQPMLKRMDEAARNAVVAIEEYGAHPDHAYLWSAQSALMDYLIAEKQLLTTIAKL